MPSALPFWSITLEGSIAEQSLFPDHNEGFPFGSKSLIYGAICAACWKCSTEPLCGQLVLEVVDDGGVGRTHASEVCWWGHLFLLEATTKIGI